ncbi:MAG: hypothetical protein IKH36_02925 [Bacilli bacterium]|nr:hypothetical protein [Bacilli bacterium]MBR4672039.1 hypothetical protein [Bacilli bacterium]
MLKQALKILNTIEENGYKAYIVGGFVRDYVLGINSLDVDIATNATPQQIMGIFPNSVLPKEEYGSITIYIKNDRFEITTFRREIKYINNRKPIEIEYIDDLIEDLKRRDFKMNTLCMDKTGRILDYFDGKKDIENKVINTVGNSDAKFSQDSLRILRAVRFATILNFELSNEVKSAIIKNKSLLRNLSYSRKKQELDKIFSSVNSKYGVSLLLELGLDQDLEIYNLDKINITNDIIGTWASLEFSDKYAQEFSSSEKSIIKDIKEVLKTGITNETLYRYGLYTNQIVAAMLGYDKSKIVGIYEALPIKSKKEINILGCEIEKILNKKPGIYIREIYNKLEEEILNHRLENNKEKLEEFIIQNYS